METISLSEIEKFITFELLSIKRRKNALIFPSTPKKIIGGCDIMISSLYLHEFRLNSFMGQTPRVGFDPRTTRDRRD